MTDIKHKLDRLEEHFILEELTADLYQKYKAKFEQEIDQMEEQRAENQIEIYIAFAMSCCINLSKIWASGDYTQRQELQNSLFENGIVYYKQNNLCRSLGENEFITTIAESSKNASHLKADPKKIDLSSVSEGIVSKCRSHCTEIC